MTLLILFPCFILGMFSYHMVKQTKAHGIVFQHIMWMVYSLFLVYQFISGIITERLTNSATTWIYGAVIGIIIIGAVIYNKQLRGWFAKEIDEARGESGARIMDDATRNIQRQAEQGQKLETFERMK